MIKISIHSHTGTKRKQTIMEEAGSINYNILKGKTRNNGKMSIILKI